MTIRSANRKQLDLTLHLLRTVRTILRRATTQELSLAEQQVVVACIRLLDDSLRLAGRIGSSTANVVS